jgi:nitrogen fixation NifU-like protein
MSGSGSELYREDILEHYKNPENFGSLDPCTFAHEGENPLCGDVLELTVRLDEDDVIEAARFDGQGCAISQASTDILLSRIEGEPLDDVLAMDEDALVELLGIDVPPLRVKCAVLPLVTVQDGARIHRGEMDPIDVTKTEG